MNEQLLSFIPAVVAEIQARRGYVTKTKLLKILYLIDVEYFRESRRTYTGFSWIFLHLGPWTAEFDDVLEKLTATGNLTQRNTDNDVALFKAAGAPDLDRLFATLREGAPFKKVLNTWADTSTREILDYVYFQTEPMESAERGKPLDFSTIPQGPFQPYRRADSGASASEILARKKKLLLKTQKLSKNRPVRFTPPSYDREFFEAMEKLNDADR